jgi:hypothetical protein
MAGGGQARADARCGTVRAMAGRGSDMTQYAYHGLDSPLSSALDGAIAERYEFVLHLRGEVPITFSIRGIR